MHSRIGTSSCKAPREPVGAFLGASCFDQIGNVNQNNCLGRNYGSSSGHHLADRPEAAHLPPKESQILNIDHLRTIRRRSIYRV